MDIQKEMRDTISKNIIFYRKKCGLTQAQLADKVGYTDKSVEDVLLGLEIKFAAIKGETVSEGMS